MALVPSGKGWLYSIYTFVNIGLYTRVLGAFHLVRTQFYMLSGPPPPLFACNTQWKCIGDLNPPSPPRCVRTKWKAPYYCSIMSIAPYVIVQHRHFTFHSVTNRLFKYSTFLASKIIKPYFEI